MTREIDQRFARVKNIPTGTEATSSNYTDTFTLHMARLIGRRILVTESGTSKGWYVYAGREGFWFHRDWLTFE